MVLGRLIGVFVVGLALSACDGVTPVNDNDDKKPLSLNGTLTQVAALENESDCPNGGVTLAHGIDLNGDGSLEDDEVTHTYVICHGTDGADANNDQVNATLAALQTEIDALKAAVELNTAKVGLSEEQEAQLAANTLTLADLGNHAAFDGWDKSVADDADYLTEETDPVASAAGYLVVETDPIASAAGYLITETDPVASAAGYLTTETDPVASAAGYLTAETDPVASAAGYLTTETDPVASAAGYLTSFTEIDPVATGVFANLGNHSAFEGWDKNAADDPLNAAGLTEAQAEAIAHVDVLDTRLGILARDNYSNYDSMDFSWNGMREFNYLTSEEDPVASAAGYLLVETDPVASNAGYLTSYTETDPVASAVGYLTADSELLYMFGDYDNDNVVNIDDNCAFDSNSNQVDADGDGKGDLCDSSTPPTLMSTDNKLMFTRCPVGIDFLEGFVHCRSWFEQEGGFSSSNFQYCPSDDSSCNDTSTGLLNGNMDSDLFNACDSLQLDGHSDWRVPNREEMSVWASDVLAKGYVGTAEWTTSKFWTSEAATDNYSYVYDKNDDEF